MIIIHNFDQLLIYKSVFSLKSSEIYSFIHSFIKNAFIDKCVVLGDFNLDYEKVYDDNYAHKLLFEDFEITLSMCNLVQIVNFVTWSRLVGVTLKSSTLDHIYIKDPTLLKNISSIKPIFGDHLLIMFTVNGLKRKSGPVKMRDWRRYSKDLLNLELSKLDWNIGVDDVQQFWNIFESRLIRIVDSLVPLVDHHNNVIKRDCF